MATRAKLVDVHHHFVPKCYVDAFAQSAGDPSGWTLPKWSVDSSKALMSNLNIGVSILSLTAPGCSIVPGPAAATLARDVNLSAAAVRDSDPEHFGFFATLPPILDDVPAALAEIAYSLDVLKADGVTLYTRYGPGNAYLGHEDLKPIWDELDRRRAVVFVHPTHSVDTRLANSKLPQPVIDYPHETTRTAVDLITSNTVRDYPNCKIILSHAGGTLPYLATRAAGLLSDFGLSSKSPAEFLEDARTFYYDLALSSNKYTLSLLTEFAQESHILFGSDFPYAPTKTIETHTKSFEDFEFGDVQRRNLSQDNALQLLPRFKSTVL